MNSFREHRRFRRKYSQQFANNGKAKTNLWLDRKSERHIRNIAFLFFIGLALIYIFGSKTLISWNIISRIFFGIAVALSFIPNKWLPVIYRIRKEMKVLLSLFALTPMLTGLILLSNFIFIVQSQEVSYKVDKTVTYTNDYLFKVILENDELDQFHQVRTFSSDKFTTHPDSAHYTIATGIFSFKTIRKASLTP